MIGGVSTPAVDVGKRTERLATLAVVLAVLSALFSALIVPGVLAVVLGVLARRAATDAGGRSPKATVGIVVGAMTAVVGVAVWVTNAPTIFESPSYRTLRVGDCYERPDNDPRFIAPQSCQGQHGREVVAVLDDPAARGLSYPGLEAIRRDLDPLCRAAAEDYVSGSLDQAPLRVFRIYPSRESWNDGNRRVVCALGSKDRRPLVGSLRNRRLAAS
jgi:hypothetical protein